MKHRTPSCPTSPRLLLLAAALLPTLFAGLADPLAASPPASPPAPPATAENADPVAIARLWRQAHEAEILRDYAELLALPNVASDGPNLRRNARELARQLEARGIEAEVWELDEPAAAPLVYGALDVPGATRTLGIYVHYDGQPVDPDRWTWPPWQPTLTTAALENGGKERPWPEDGEAVDPEWRIYARSAGDDKAPFPALFAALDAFREAGIAVTSNLRFLFEGEEEAGSPHLEQYLRAHRDKLSADLWLICDGPVHPTRRPQLVFGVRGYTGFDLTVYGATRALHSGHYGNWAINPAQELARLLASMKDADGKVLIEGFYDSTVPPGEAERQAIAALPDDDDRLRRELGLGATEGGGAPLLERLLIPSLNVRGLESAAVGEKARNLIPTTAHASLDVRLARGNDPVEMLDLVEAHVQAQGFHVVREEPDLETRLAHPRIAKLDRRPGYPAVRTPLDQPEARAVIEAAERAAGEAVILMPTLGGSLPLYLFTDVLQSPVVIVPIANHDDNQHAPDENIRIANLWYGVDLMAALLTLPPESSED